MLYPKYALGRAMQANPGLKRMLWEFMNNISPEVLVREGRVYGGGLYKLEPKELANVKAEEIAELVPDFNVSSTVSKQLSLF